jgi:cholesterol transport system auxiliary component
MRIAALLVALLAGCASFGPREADRYFVLEAAGADGAAHASPHNVSVAPTTAASFYDTQSIAYSRAAGTRGYYQFNHWTERPQRAIHAQLASRLANDGAQGTLVLRTHLEEIYHDAAVPPGTARLAIRAELVDAASRTVVARRTFSRAAPAPSYDADGAVRGFDAALGRLIDDIVAWVEEHADRKRP